MYIYIRRIEIEATLGLVIVLEYSQFEYFLDWFIFAGGLVADWHGVYGFIASSFSLRCCNTIFILFLLHSFQQYINVIILFNIWYDDVAFEDDDDDIIRLFFVATVSVYLES